jgi:hypothetical protein
MEFGNTSIADLIRGNQELASCPMHLTGNSVDAIMGIGSASADAMKAWKFEGLLSGANMSVGANNFKANEGYTAPTINSDLSTTSRSV